MKSVNIYTDGGCLGNPGRGGYAAILEFTNDYIELSGGFRLTTNNRMELMACIAGLEALDQGYNVTVFSDSRYLVDGVTKGWVFTWKKNNWRRSNGALVENIDLWERILVLLRKHQVKFVWVKGHNGHPENERCDQFATAAANSSVLLEDTGYTSRGVSSQFD